MFQRARRARVTWVSRGACASAVVAVLRKRRSDVLVLDIKFSMSAQTLYFELDMRFHVLIICPSRETRARARARG